jgi:hypothetical protein
MKNSTFIIVTIMVLTLFSCKQNDSNDAEYNMHMNKNSRMMHQDSTMMHDNTHMMDSETKYSCPMHPEVHGNKNEKCSECGIDLKIANTETSEEDK